MRLSEADHEFRIRMYYWDLSEFENEIARSFPNFRLFKSGEGWKLCRFMQGFEPSNQLKLAHAQLKLRYQSEIIELGLDISEEEKGLVEAYREFALQPSSREFEIVSKKRAGEKIKYATKRKLRKTMVSKFIETYGSQCVHTETGEGWDPQFHMRCCGWIINTQLVLSRHQGVFWFRHLIQSEDRVPHPKIPELGSVPAVSLPTGAAWLQTRWEDIMDNEVESVSNEVVKIAGYFFEAAPKLLKGLEFDRITKE